MEPEVTYWTAAGSLALTLSLLPLLVRGPNKVSAVMPDVIEEVAAEEGGGPAEGPPERGKVVRPAKPGATALALVAPVPSYQ